MFEERARHKEGCKSETLVEDKLPAKSRADMWIGATQSGARAGEATLNPRIGFLIQNPFSYFSLAVSTKLTDDLVSNMSTIHLSCLGNFDEGCRCMSPSTPQ